MKRISLFRNNNFYFLRTAAPICWSFRIKGLVQSHNKGILFYSRIFFSVKFLPNHFPYWEPGISERLRGCREGCNRQLHPFLDHNRKWMGDVVMRMDFFVCKSWRFSFQFLLKTLNCQLIVWNIFLFQASSNVVVCSCYLQQYYVLPFTSRTSHVPWAYMATSYIWNHS